MMSRGYRIGEMRNARFKMMHHVRTDRGWDQGVRTSNWFKVRTMKTFRRVDDNRYFKALQRAEETGRA